MLKLLIVKIKYLTEFNDGQFTFNKKGNHTVYILFNDKLEYLNKQARIQAEHYGSKNYADRVLEVYERAIKEKKEQKVGAEVLGNIRERNERAKVDSLEEISGEEEDIM